MKKRPLVCISISFATGIILADFMGSFLFAFLCMILILTDAVFYMMIRIDRLCFLTAVLLIAAMTAGYIETALILGKDFSFLDQFDGKTAHVTGRIESEPDYRENDTRYVLRAHRIEAINEEVNMLLIAKNDKIGNRVLLEYGQNIELKGKVSLPEGKRNPGGFDYRFYLRSKGINAVISSGAGTIEIQPGSVWDESCKLGSRIRKKLVNIIEMSLPQKHSALLNGMLLGADDGISPELSEDFSRTGLIHIMCVSGANISFVVLFSIFVCGLLKMKKHTRYIITIGVIVLFASTAGFSPPVSRAALMGMIILLGKIIDRDSDIYTSIALASLVILLLNPLAIYDIGFQLSFAGTLSLVLFYNNLKKLFRFLPPIIADIAVCTTAAQIGAAPIVLYYFNIFSIISFVTNILVVPVTGFITILGFIAVAAGSIYVEISRFILGINYFLLSFIIFIVEKLSALRFSVIYTPTPSILQIAVFYAISVFMLIAIHKIPHCDRKKYMCAAAAVMILTLAPYSSLWNRDMEVTFIDVGQGDCAFIRTRGGKTVLVDTGGKSTGMGSFDAGKDIVAPFLFDKGVWQVDIIVLSHAHLDHTGGLPSIMERIRVKSVVVSEQTYDLPEFSEIRDVIERSGAKVIKAGLNDRINLDKDCYLDFLSSGIDAAAAASTMAHKDRGFKEESWSNNGSYIFKLCFKETEVLFTGDAEAEAEEKILSAGRDISARILKVAHHGSAYSTGKSFINAVKPQLAVISVGQNTYGHPDEDGTIKRLTDSGAVVMRTDECGAVTLYSDGKRISVYRMTEG